MTYDELFKELMRLQNEMTAIVIQLCGRRRINNKICFTCNASTEFVGYCKIKERDCIGTKTCGEWRA